MSDIEDLERRITAAMERIGRSIDGMSAAPADGGDAVADLQKQLEEERMVTAQLEARVAALKERQELAGDVEARMAAQSSHIKRLDSELQQLQAANQQLRDNNAALRDANEKGVAEPHLINKSMMAELDALRAARAADRSELDAILSELKPIVEESA
ncbi:hypothetical protein [Nereida sp. MMG025]|uniref:hypothetical protein n=1 Tax=Nereida sp. MMG025 TaxID=2909981 RepID=UPI001F2C922C|nr:hypothetical protein [Nereida sp. MMG025]MCF6443619.1 hypothetical protein [Nereida sp. MMG025]